MKKAILKTILVSLPQVLKVAGKTNKDFNDHLCAASGVVQLSLKDGSVAQYIIFSNGKVTTSSGIHPNPDVKIHRDWGEYQRMLLPFRC